MIIWFLVSILLLSAALFGWYQYKLGLFSERVLLLTLALAFVLVAVSTGREQLARPAAVQKTSVVQATSLTVSAQLKDWHQASPADQTATAYELLVQLRQTRFFTEPIRSIREYQPWTRALIACLNAVEGQETATLDILAQGCVQAEGLRRWR